MSLAKRKRTLSQMDEDTLSPIGTKQPETPPTSIAPWDTTDTGRIVQHDMIVSRPTKRPRKKAPMVWEGHDRMATSPEHFCRPWQQTSPSEQASSYHPYPEHGYSRRWTTDLNLLEQAPQIPLHVSNTQHGWLEAQGAALYTGGYAGLHNFEPQAQSTTHSAIAASEDVLSHGLTRARSHYSQTQWCGKFPACTMDVEALQQVIAQAAFDKSGYYDSNKSIRRLLDGSIDDAEVNLVCYLIAVRSR